MVYLLSIGGFAAGTNWVEELAAALLYDILIAVVLIRLLPDSCFALVARICHDKVLFDFPSALHLRIFSDAAYKFLAGRWKELSWLFTKFSLQLISVLLLW